MTPRTWPKNPPPLSYASQLTRPLGHDKPTVSDEYRRRWAAHDGLVEALRRLTGQAEIAADLFRVLSRDPRNTPAIDWSRVTPDLKAAIETATAALAAAEGE